MNKDLTVAVLVGGLGTRLRSVIADRPKALAPVLGRPYLTYLLDQVAQTGADEVVLTGTLDAATWGAELAIGEGPGRIYIVEPTGPIENDPNLTDKKFPGNPTRSYRSRESLRVKCEVTAWRGHSPEQLKAMKDGLRRAKEQGVEPIDE